MTTENLGTHLVAVVGAGPAGLFAARYLANHGVRVALFNRDIKPGGLAEYGIYPDKLKMKDGLRKQFRQILASPLLTYYGNTVVCGMGNLTIYDLMAAGFQAILVTTGAQGTKWLGLPGETLDGVYHAKDLVYFYNRLPPFSQKQFAIRRRVALIGVGNVMMDIAHWLIREVKVDDVIAIARRGPAEVKFTKKEMEAVAANLDLAALDAEFERVAPIMQQVGQDVAAAKDAFLSALPKALPKTSETRFRFEFLASPTEITGGCGEVCGLEVEDNTLTPANGDTKARSLGTRRCIDVDTVIFCIGDCVDRDFCLPVRNNEFIKLNPPRFPIEQLSYEAYDPETGQAMENVFLAGWARQASYGLVGVARKDGENGAEAVLHYLDTLPALNAEAVLCEFDDEFRRFNPAIVDKELLPSLEDAEREEAQRRGLEEFKFASNEEMLAVLGLSLPQPARLQAPVTP